LTDEFFPGIHYLELSETDRQPILELRKERAEAESEARRVDEELKQVRANDARKERKREESAARHSKKRKLKLDAAVQKRRKHCASLLRNLEFDTAALERLELLSMAGEASQIDEKLGLINAGQVAYRDSIPDTQPKTYEAKAGYDYRIYYYRDGARIRIRLIGDKGTQESDINQLRRQTTSRCA
jgi:hypothetical protein